MLPHSSRRSAVFDGQDPMSLQGWARRATAVVLALLPLACSPAPPAFRGTDPSDPQAPVRPIAYRSTVAGYTSRRPAEPRPWSEQNRRVAPAEQP